MSSNKKVVEVWLDAIARLDKAALLSCLVEDAERVEWADGFPESGVPQRGKATIVQKMDRPADVALRFDTTRMIEEGNNVVAEGFAHITPKEGEPVTLKFCDIFEFEGGKLKRLDAFTVLVKAAKEA